MKGAVSTVAGQRGRASLVTIGFLYWSRSFYGDYRVERTKRNTLCDSMAQTHCSLDDIYFLLPFLSLSPLGLLNSRLQSNYITENM